MNKELLQLIPIFGQVAAGLLQQKINNYYFRKDLISKIKFELQDLRLKLKKSDSLEDNSKVIMAKNAYLQFNDFLKSNGYFVNKHFPKLKGELDDIAFAGIDVLVDAEYMRITKESIKFNLSDTVDLIKNTEENIYF